MVCGLKNLKKQKDSCLRNFIFAENLFFSAAASEDIETLQAYRDAGANLSECDYDNRTALHVVSLF